MSYYVVWTDNFSFDHIQLKTKSDALDFVKNLIQQNNFINEDKIYIFEGERVAFNVSEKRIVDVREVVDEN